MLNDQLAVQVTHADGRTTRWGGDEPDAINVPMSLRFSTSIPGGFKDCTITLARRIDTDYADLNLLDDIRVYGPGNETVWEGRVAQLPRSHGDTFSVTVGCVGHAAHLRDDPSFREVYIDRDLGRWGEPSSQQVLDRIAAGWNPAVGRSTVRPDQGGKLALWQETNGVLNKPEVWAFYDIGGGLTVGRVRAQTVDSFGLGAGDAANWDLFAEAYTDDHTFDSQSGDQSAGVPVSDFEFAPTTPTQFVALVWRYNSTSAGAAGFMYGVRWDHLAVHGNHGLTIQGTDYATQGYYVSDIVADIIERAAPRLRFTTGDGGSIEPTGLIVPHFEVRDPRTGEDALLIANKFDLNEWGVYENREFFLRPADPGRLCWEARLDEGAHIDLEGDQGEDIYNGVFVAYQDFSGQKKTVGPPGASSDEIDDALIDTNPDNVATAHGYERKWGKLEIGQPVDLAGATAIGVTWLRERSLPARRGKIVLRGTAKHPTIETRQSARRVRAGDWIRITDHSADVPRRIIQTSYDSATRTLSADVGNDIHQTDAILERVGVRFVGRM